MKSHISATIEKNLLEDLNRFSREERRTRSQIIEMALEQYLRGRTMGDGEITTSPARFEGRFSRDETYAR